MELELKGKSEYCSVAYNTCKEVLISADVTAPAVYNNTYEQHSGIDFVAVIDRSGSMSGTPFELVKKSLLFVVDNLKQNDQFSIVSFGNEANLELTLTKMNKKGKEDARNVIRKMTISGCTNLSDGMLTGIRQIRNSMHKNVSSTVILLTDGMANQGITRTPELVSKLKEELTRIPGSVNVFTFGFGLEHSAEMLRAIADAANGMYYYCEHQDAIKVQFAECLGGLLSVAGRKIDLVVQFPPSVRMLDMMGKYEHHKVNDTTYKITLEDIYSEEQKNIPMRVKLEALKAPSETVIQFTMTYINTAKDSNPQETASCNVTIQRNEGGKEEVDGEQSMELDEQRNRILTANALDKATQLGMQHNLKGAQDALLSAKDHIEASISHNSLFCQGLIRDLLGALALIDKSGHNFDHVASKYMYSLARSHYNQRSSGISTSAAAAYLTSTQKNMMNSVNANSNTNTSNTISNTTTSNNINILPVDKKAKSAAPENRTAAKDSKSNQIQIGDFVLVNNQPKTTVRDVSTKSNTVEDARKSMKPVVSKDLIAKSIRRLMLDLQEIQSSPLQTVTAAPLDKDFFEWHCNLRSPGSGEYDGIVFHLVMIFPHTYPIDPPKLFICSYISHQHVYGSWICLDLLEEAQWSNPSEMGKAYTGWSSAYSVHSILLQLQSFLFDKADKDQVAIQKAKTSAAQLQCTTCGHSSINNWPEFAATAAVGNNQPAPKDHANVTAPTRVVRIVKGRKPAPYAGKCATLQNQGNQDNHNIKPNQSKTVQTNKPKNCWEVPLLEKLKLKAPHENAENNINNNNKNNIPLEMNNNNHSINLATTIHNSQNSPKEAAQTESTARKNVTQLSYLQAAQKKPLDWNSWVQWREGLNKKTPPRVEPKVPQRISSQHLPAQPPQSPQPTQPTPPVPPTPPTQPLPQQMQQSPLKKKKDLIPIVYNDSTIESELKTVQKSCTGGMDLSYFSFLVDEIIIQIFSYISPKHLGTLALVCREWRRLSNDSFLWKGIFGKFFPGVEFQSRSVQGWKHCFATEKNLAVGGLICFHTKVSYKDNVLGIPISFSRNPRTRKIDKITSTLDLLSYEAFYEDGVRSSVWKLPFTHWMPLFITSEHMDRGFDYLKDFLCQMCGASTSSFRPDMVLEVIPKLMNTMVVSLMNGDLHASLVALEGYCAFHRILLYFVKRFPELQETVNKTARNFCTKEEYRTKDVIPALGEFLPILTVSNEVSWKQICMPYLLENFDRNALWTIKKYPELAMLEKTPVCPSRLKKTFDATQVSIKLLMFHVYFFTHVARPQGLTLVQVADKYDALYGRPTSTMKENLQKKCKEILKTQTWSEFFKGIYLKPPTSSYLTQWLRTSVENSLRKGYHTQPQRGRYRR